MSTGYSWEGIRQVCATLLGARHVPERLCSGPCPQRGAIASARPYLTLPYGSKIVGVSANLDPHGQKVGGQNSRTPKDRNNSLCCLMASPELSVDFFLLGGVSRAKQF